MARTRPVSGARRHLLKAIAGGVAASFLLVQGRFAQAAGALASAFSATRIADALKAYGAPAPAASPLVSISADELAERGDNVRVVIASTVPGSDTIALFADRNPLPLAAVFRFGADALPFVATQLKLAETTNVRAVVRGKDGRYLEATRKVTVTLSGCA